MTTPRGKKPVDLPTEEAIRKLFPKRVVEEAKRAAYGRDNDPSRTGKQRKQKRSK